MNVVQIRIPLKNKIINLVVFERKEDKLSSEPLKIIACTDLVADITNNCFVFKLTPSDSLAIQWNQSQHNATPGTITNWYAISHLPDTQRHTHTSPSFRLQVLHVVSTSLAGFPI